MSDKHAGKGENLRQKYEEAKTARKAAGNLTTALMKSAGQDGLFDALASLTGSAAVESELAALKNERRALKRLYRHALATGQTPTKKKGKAQDGSQGTTPS